jgi:hypothetical protein
MFSTFVGAATGVAPAPPAGVPVVALEGDLVPLEQAAAKRPQHPTTAAARTRRRSKRRPSAGNATGLELGVVILMGTTIIKNSSYYNWKRTGTVLTHRR